MNNTRPPKWTIMVYLAGDNDLSSFCISVLQQLEAAHYREDICVLACFESNTPWPKGSRYLAVNCKHREGKKVLDWEIHNDLIKPNGRHKSGFCRTKGKNGNHYFSRPTAAEGLRRFIDWSIDKHADSERFMLVLFGHGPIVAGQTFLLAENPASFLRLEDLQAVLSQHFGDKHKRRLAILAFQNCVMNGIETAYAIRNHADFMIGSQGLVLATGWPYERMINTIVQNPDEQTSKIARELLKVCARSMLDFAVMDRSSEQSACNLAPLRGSNTLTAALKRLVEVMIEGLAFKKLDKDERVLAFPAICDAIKLARLEAQSYWGETFVDIYDFCERLIQKCNETIKAHDGLLKECGINGDSEFTFADTDLVKMAKRIMKTCVDVNDEVEKLVPASHSYYIGSELQYSHGLSIYFPWTLPAGPFFSVRTKSQTDFLLETAFDTYREYSFAKRSQWSSFLEAFFRATLRNVRRGHRTFDIKNNEVDLGLGLLNSTFETFDSVLMSDLEKSSPDTGRVNEEIHFNIKNYPRRNYLSPLDCKRKIDEAQTMEPGMPKFSSKDSPPVSSLGWNISGIVAEVIRPKAARKNKTP